MKLKILMLAIVSLFVIMAVGPILTTTAQEAAIEPFYDMDAQFERTNGDVNYYKKPLDVGILYEMNMDSWGWSWRVPTHDGDAKTLQAEVGSEVGRFTATVIPKASYNAKVGDQSTSDSNGLEYYNVNGKTTASRTSSISEFTLDEKTGTLAPHVWLSGDTGSGLFSHSSCIYLEFNCRVYNRANQLIQSYWIVQPIRVRYNEAVGQYLPADSVIHIFIPFTSPGYEHHVIDWTQFTLTQTIHWKSVELVTRSYWEFPLINAITGDHVKIAKTQAADVINEVFGQFAPSGHRSLDLYYRG